MKRVATITIILCMILFLSSIALAASNESIKVYNALQDAKKDVSDLQAASIPITRVNESLTEALQLYAAQQALEEKDQKADYSRVNKDIQDIISTKAAALKAKDDLAVFDETYNTAAKDTNLSSMQKDYEDIHRSFQEERFEDTSALIQDGYKKLSDIQSSQTTLKLFYSATSASIKGFFIKNWLKIVIILAAIIIVATITWTSIRRINLRIKLYNLSVQKKTLSSLIKKLQYDYFKQGKISQTEYNTKLDKFKEMIRDVDRKIPLLKEEMLKLKKSKK